MKKVLLLIVISLLLLTFFYFDLHHYLTFENLKAKQSDLTTFKNENLLLSILIFCSIYIGTTALSLPGATIITLLGGALFGLVLGTLLVSFSSTIGATLAFLTSRYLVRNSIESKFDSTFQKINKGIQKEGAFYLFTLRLIPLFPFFMVNLLMGITKMKTITYMWVSATGMLAGTIVYVNAGTQLAQLKSPSGILSPKLIFAFVLLGLIPFLSKKIIEHLRK